MPMVSFQLSTDRSASFCVPPSTPAFVDSQVQSRSCNGLADGVGHTLPGPTSPIRISTVAARRANGGGGLFELPGAASHHGDLRTSRGQLGGGGAPMPVPGPVTRPNGLKTR